jgi:hypothetical protein
MHEVLTYRNAKVGTEESVSDVGSVSEEAAEVERQTRRAALLAILEDSRRDAKAYASRYNVRRGAE